MTTVLSNPAFGQADLTNCERELIHLAGSIQPHGVLLVLAPDDLTVLQVSDNIGAVLGIAPAQLLNHPIALLGGDVEAEIRRVVAQGDHERPSPVRCCSRIESHHRKLEGSLHRHASGEYIVELEVATPSDSEFSTSNEPALHQRLANAVQRFSGSLTIAALTDAVAQEFRDITGYDRVMVYRFDPDGHGEIIAEARDPRLDSLLGHRYPATDIPQRARDLYIRNRVRLLVDVNYVPVPIVPRRVPTTGEELDMSLCYLRSMSPLHLQYLKNMGVTGTLVVSLIREGVLWGLVACHHYSRKYVPYAVRVMSELLAEVISTRIAAIDNYVHAQVEVMVRRLELRLIEAASTEGDWRYALFRSPRTLLQPLAATGAALFWGGETLTVGDVPSTRELKALEKWVSEQTVKSTFVCSSIERANPELRSLTPVASGVLAIELSPSRPDYLMWFRREQLCTVKWAGNPAKPMLDNDPLQLSPRRSFATWSEIVRGTATPWSRAEIAIARAIGDALVDIILQIHAVRLLIAQRQVTQLRKEIESSKEPVVIADAHGRILFSNEAFARLFQKPHVHLDRLEDISALFAEPLQVRSLLNRLKTKHEAWRGELALVGRGRDTLPVGVRADVIPAPDGVTLGFVVILTDISEYKTAEAARRRFEQSLSPPSQLDAVPDAGLTAGREPDDVIGAILANANVAAMEIADSGNGALVVSLLEELETSTRRAAALYQQLRNYTGRS